MSHVVLICENCVWGRPAIGYCKECPVLLCNSCKEYHPQTRATRTHAVVDDLTDQREKHIAKLEEDEATCKEHNQICVSYCQTCYSKLCKMCLPAHQQHTTFNIVNNN